MIAIRHDVMSPQCTILCLSQAIHSTASLRSIKLHRLYTEVEVQVTVRTVLSTRPDPMKGKVTLVVMVVVVVLGIMPVVKLKLKLKLKKVYLQNIIYMPCKKPGKDAEASTQSGLSSIDISGLIVKHGSYIA